MFNSKKPEAPQRPVTPTSRAAPASTFSVLGADMAIKGDVSASAELHIDGRIEGDVSCAALVQGESSMIVGAITAETARLSGSVQGSITVRDLSVLRSARIHGDVHYETLTIEQGAQVQGQFAQKAGGHLAAVPNDPAEPKLSLASSS